GALRELVEARGLFGLLDEPAQLGHSCGVLLRQRCLIRLAALARAEARELGVRARPMKLHVLPFRPACCARGPAVHAGGLDRVDELAVRCGIASDHRAPTGIFYGACRELAGIA